MHISDFEAKVSAARSGASGPIAAAAYRAGTKPRMSFGTKFSDYAPSDEGRISSTILAPEGAPGWVFNQGSLERGPEDEARNGWMHQLRREFILALPKELSAEANPDGVDA